MYFKSQKIIKRNSVPYNYTMNNMCVCVCDKYNNNKLQQEKVI